MSAGGGRVVVVAGATGLVGRELVRALSETPSVAEVRALVRRDASFPSAKVTIWTARDTMELESCGAFVGADAVFCALGTTIKAAGSRAAFRAVDETLVLAVARLGRRAGARAFLLVSAVGANPRSAVFYSRVKGEVEGAVTALGYPTLAIARPSFLIGDRSERRPAEELAKRFGWLLPAPWAPVEGRAVADALVGAMLSGEEGVRVIGNREF